MTSLRILLFLEEFLPRTETFVFNQLKSLTERHAVQLICIRRSNEQIYSAPEIQIHAVGPSYTSKTRLYFESRLIYPQIKIKSLSKVFNQLVHEFKPDVLLTHFGPNALYVLDSTLLSALPLVYFVHGYDASVLLTSSSSYRKRFRKILNEKNSYPLFVCRALHQNTTEIIGFSFPPRILHMGIDTNYFQRQKSWPQNNEMHFLQVGSFVEKKAQSLTIKAFAKWNNKNAMLTFIGDGPLREKCESLSQQLKISQRVRFVGHQNRNDVRKALDESHVFLHPSTTSSRGDMEGIPTAIMEAMAMKLPVLTTNHSGIPELVEHGVNGFVVDAGDPNTITAHFQKTFDLGELSCNRDKIISDFDLSKQTIKLEDFLFQITGINA